MNVNLNLYKYFYEVAKYNSFTKAAESLMVSQPSLSYSIKVLEEQLGKKLFNRSNHGINLTSDGEKIFNKLKYVFKLLDEISEDTNGISSKVVLGVRSAYATNILPFYINEFNKRYPNLEIDFIIGVSDQILSLLNNNEIDIMIDEYKLDGDYVSVPNLSVDSIFFTTKNKYEELKNKKLDLSYFLENPVYLIKRDRVTKQLKEKYPNIKNIIIQSTPLMLKKIENDNLIGVSPKIIIRNELESGILKELKTDIELPKSEMYLTYLKKMENIKIKTVVDFFNKYILDENK